MNEDLRRQLNVKVPQDLWEELEKSDLPRQKIVVDALNIYFHRDLQTSTTNEKDLRSEIEYLRAKLDETLRLLHQEQALHLQTQRQIMPSPEEIAKKSWWQFWKK